MHGGVPDLTLLHRRTHPADLRRLLGNHARTRRPHDAGTLTLTRTVILAGATGYIGSRLALELVEHGYTLVCPVRDPAAANCRILRERCHEAAVAGADERLKLIKADITDRGSLFSALDSVAGTAIQIAQRSARRGSTEGAAVCAVSCLASRSGAPDDSERVEYAANRNLLDWCLEHRVDHFTLLSAICVQKPRLAFQAAKLRFERELGESGMSHSIVRPTAFFKSLSGQVNRVRDGKPFLIFGDGRLTACKPIAEADLARYLRLTLEDPELRGVLPVGGPGPALTPLDQARMLAELCGQPLRTRSVPPTLLAFIGRVLGLGGRFLPTLAAKAEFARIGHYYATESMLLWDADQRRYDADATPEFGSHRLIDSYRAQLEGRETQDLAEHAMFE
ncbi:MAG: NAD(P)H-binding protein [Halieaceae bacterium]|nr:NAD(P)H-binding protein [Halieaceae bacterium]